VRTKAFNRKGYALLAVAVVRQAEEDLDHEDAFIREYAEDWLFGKDEIPLLRWLLRLGCSDADAFRDSLLRKRKKLAA